MKIINVEKEDGYCELCDRTGSLWWCRITGEECDGRDGEYIPSSCRLIDVPDECKECITQLDIRND